MFRFLSPTYWFPEDPHQVLEVRAEDYSRDRLVCKHDCGTHDLALYRSDQKKKKKLDIVLINRAPSNEAFSILRSEDEESCLLVFRQFCEKLPLLVPNIAVSLSTLKEVTRLLREKTSWTVAHVAAHFGYCDCFRNELVRSQVNVRCGDTLLTPLHVALKTKRMDSVVRLVEVGASPDIADAGGETAFHYAANTTKGIVQALCRRPVRGDTNALNSNGCTPFHLACMAGDVDYAMELIEVGVDVNLGCREDMGEILDAYSQRYSNEAIRYGGTPLHWSTTPKLAEVLIEQGCDVNTRNSRGDTALHAMVKCNRLSCAVALLSHHVDVDIRNEGRNTPLHLAVKERNLSLVQAFIAFGADLDATNQRGETPRHLAAGDERRCGEILYALHVVGARRCGKPMAACAEGCAAGGQFNGLPPRNCDFSRNTETMFEAMLDSVRAKGIVGHPPPEGCRVLSLDGGGIRGLVLIQMLDEVERLTGRSIAHSFDLVAGTSTGGMLALALATGKTMSDCRCLYFRLKDKVFVPPRPYNADLLENFLKDELGESTAMGDIQKPRLMITATRGDRKPADLHIFRNYKSPLEILNCEERDPLTDEVLPDPRARPIWQAARATGSAPTYFRASGPFVDGGLLSNNPTLDALTEIHQCNQALVATDQADKVTNIRVVVSLGTGRPPLVPVDTIDVFRPDTLSDACRMIPRLKDLIELLVDQVTQTDGRVTARTRAVCGMLDIPYFRLNPQLTEDVALDETKTATLVKMLWETTAYIRGMRDELQTLVQMLSSPS